MENTKGIIITGNGTLNIQSNNNASIFATDSVTIMGGTITTNERIYVGAPFEVAGGVVTSTQELQIGAGISCTVTGGTLILDTSASAIGYPGDYGYGPWEPGLASANVVGKDGQPLVAKEVKGRVNYYDAAGNISPYAKITAAGSAAQPQQPAAPQQPADLAYASTQSVLVDGGAVEFQMYALKDEKGNDTNYIKLRDLAQSLNGTAAQFEVGWNGAVNIETNKAYTSNGSEMKTPFSGNRAYEKATAVTNVNGSAAGLTAFILKDDNGGAYTYYQLRDLGRVLGFNVGWSAEKGIFVETDKPYQG